MPPLPAAALASLTRAVMLAVWGPAVGRALFGATLLAYVAYDCAHYAIHFAGTSSTSSSTSSSPAAAKPARWPSSPWGRLARMCAEAADAQYLRPIRRRHLAHHYRDTGSNFGISSCLFDVLFGTLAKQEAGR